MRPRVAGATVEAEGEGSQHAVASVLDASALMALVHREEGVEGVVEAIVAGAAISVVNLAEVLSKLAEATPSSPPIPRRSPAPRARV